MVSAGGGPGTRRGADQPRVSYADGRGVPQDDAEADRWFELSNEYLKAKSKRQASVYRKEKRGRNIDELERRWNRKLEKMEPGRNGSHLVLMWLLFLGQTQSEIIQILHPDKSWWREMRSNPENASVGICLGIFLGCLLIQYFLDTYVNGRF